MDTEMSLTEYLRFVRKRQGITLREIGERMAKANGLPNPISQTLINDQIARGESVSVKRLRALCDAMDCDLDIRIIPRT